MTAVRKPEAGTEDSMITCKLCNTELDKRHLRRDGSLLCPGCGQIYWKAAVDRAMAGGETFRENYAEAYRRESRRSVERIRRVRVA